MKIISNIFFVLVFSFLAKHSVAQSNFTTIGNWSETGKWSAGIPDGNDDVNINFGVTLTADMDGSCNNLSQLASSLVVNNGVTLNINGVFTVSTIGATTNNGTMVLNGNIKPALGTADLTVGGRNHLNWRINFPNN